MDAKTHIYLTAAEIRDMVITKAREFTGSKASVAQCNWNLTGLEDAEEVTSEDVEFSGATVILSDKTGKGSNHG